jgi:ketosteroid isomerase-like protein
MPLSAAWCSKEDSRHRESSHVQARRRGHPPIVRRANAALPHEREPAMRRSSAMKIAHMQSDGNAAIVRRAYEAFNTADIATLAKLFDSNTSWHTPGRSSLAGDRKGRDAVFTQFGRYGGETRGTFRANLLNVLESEDGRAVAVHHTSAERNGRRLDVLCCIVFELHNGRILIGREHFYDLYAWDAFWS